MSKGSTLASDPTIEGLWREPGQARAAAARLSVDAAGTATVVHASSGVTLASAPFSAVTVSARIGSIPRHLEFPGGDFETRDNDGVDGLERRLRRHAGLVHRLELFRPRLLLFVALAAALAVALYRYAVPVLVEVAVAVTPPAVTGLMSKGVLASLDRAVFDESGLPEERRKRLADGFAELTTLVAVDQQKPQGEPARYSLHFRKGGAIGPNAFALPDGTIVLTDELARMTDDDELIMAVLAHEIGHVEHAHSLRQLYRAAGVTALIMLIGGDVGAATEDVLVQGAAVLSLSYSRHAERDADRYSVDLMHRAGRDAAAITRFFVLMQREFGEFGRTDFLSSHPATPERIEETERYAAEISGSGK